MIKGQLHEQLLAQGQLEGLFQFKKGKTYILLSEKIFRSMNLIYDHLKLLLKKNQKVTIIDGIGRIRFEELKNRISLKLYEEIAKKSINYYHPIIHDYQRFKDEPFNQLRKTLEHSNFALVIEPSCIFYDVKSSLIFTKEEIDDQYSSFLKKISKETKRTDNITLIFDREDSPLYTIAIFNQFDDFEPILEKVIITRYDPHFPRYTGFDIIDLSGGKER